MGVMTEASHLTAEAAALAIQAAFPPGRSSGDVGGDVVQAMLLARADVDRIQPTGRLVRAKRTILRISKLFLRDQASFNRASIVALEDLGARLDRLEAAIDKCEADAGRPRQA
jgi:hypothetical protein